jgi:arginine exporter protein ArgO
MMGAALTLLGLIESDIGLVRAALLAAGVFSGSLLWWAILVTGVNTVQRQIPPAIVGWINRAAGLILVVLGVIAFGRGLI